jgi:hypothetical protein
MTWRVAKPLYDAAEGGARFLNEPGPVVVGATQGAACFGAAYEFVFNVTYHLKGLASPSRVQLRQADEKTPTGGRRDLRPSQAT